jgi:hypothetical protein
VVVLTGGETEVVARVMLNDPDVAVVGRSLSMLVEVTGVAVVLVRKPSTSAVDDRRDPGMSDVALSFDAVAATGVAAVASVEVTKAPVVMGVDSLDTVEVSIFQSLVDVGHSSESI